VGGWLPRVRTRERRQHLGASQALAETEDQVLLGFAGAKEVGGQPVELDDVGGGSESQWTVGCGHMTDRGKTTLSDRLIELTATARAAADALSVSLPFREPSPGHGRCPPSPTQTA
jgi:hypothetical protein